MKKFNFMTLGMPQLGISWKTIKGMGWSETGHRMAIEIKMALVPLTVVERYEVSNRTSTLFNEKVVKGEIEEFKGITRDLLYQACSCEAMQIKAASLATESEPVEVYSYVDLIIAVGRSETIWEGILDAMTEVNVDATKLDEDEENGDSRSPLP